MSSQVSTLRGFALRPRHVLPTLCAVGVLCGSVAGQQQTPFKSGASTVAVYTTVTDSTGRLVPDLTKDDFEIYDNGKLQPLTLFATETQPITVVVMLDRSGSMKESFNLVSAGAEEFVKRLLPADKARIGSFATKIADRPRGVHERSQEAHRHPALASSSPKDRRRSGTPPTSRCGSSRRWMGARSCCSSQTAWIRPGTSRRTT